MKQIIWLLALALLAQACSDEEAKPQLNYTLPDTPDIEEAEPEPDPVQEELDNFAPPAVADICQERQVRCLATRSGATLECVPQQTATGQTALRWSEGACPQEQVCINNACAPFSCVPQEPACDGAGLQGICDSTGSSLVNRQPCPQGTSCRGGVCVNLCDSAARARSYIGCDYMLVSLPNPVNDVGNDPSPEDGPYGLVISNPEPLQAVTVSVQRQDGQFSQVRPQVEVRISPDAVDFLQNQTPQTVTSAILDSQGQQVQIIEGDAQDIEIPPGGLATLLLEIDRLPYRGTGVHNVAQRLQASHPVVAYQFSPYCCNYTFTNDASLLLPTTALGTQYTALGAPEWQELPPGLAVIATEDNTQVELTLPAGQPPSYVQDAEYEEGSLRTTLQSGQTLYIDTPQDMELFSDLTGTTVEASAPVAVFSTHLCSFIPHSQPACDHLEEQLIPNDTWGSQYILSTPERRGPNSREYTYWRILAGAEGAVFDLGVPLQDLDILAPFSSQLVNCRFFRVPGEDNLKFQLDAHQDCVVGTRRSTTLSANSPLQVMGFMAGEAAASNGEDVSIGDPSMFLLAPVEQFRDDYTFLTPATYAQDYMTLILLRDAAGGLTLDGAPLDPQDPDLHAEPVLGSRYMLLHVPVGDGAHRVQGTAPFGLLVYAYDRYVSYAYTGGLNLTKRAR